jgi:hypothetical protein
VIDNLIEPLSRSRTNSGERPRIFFDAKGIDVSQNWQQALAEAITKSHKVVPVYSRRYFQKPMCQWELGLFWTLDPIGELKKINPVLIDPEAEDDVPIQYSLIQYLSIDTPDWLERLCHSLQLRIDQEPTVLTFQDQPPAKIAVNHTLPALTVQMKLPTGQVGDEQQIEISCSQSQLQGTLRRMTKKGMAVFDDISLETPTTEAQLIATAKGCHAAQSKLFQVLPHVAVSRPTPAPPPDHALPALSPRIKHLGKAIFFAGGTRLAVVGGGLVTVYDLTGVQIGPSQDVDDTLRLVHCADQNLVLVDWWGRVLVLGSEAPLLDWEGPSQTEGLWVAGDTAVHGNRLFIGYWTGDIYYLDMDGSAPPTRLHHHTDGIGHLAWAGTSLLMADLQGRLLRFQDRSNTEITRIEGNLHQLKPYADCVVAVGDKMLHYLRFKPDQVFGEKLPPNFSRVSSVLGQSQYPVVMDSQGKGFRFDAGLKLVVQFATGPGAVPVSADEAGVYCVLKNTDESWSLMIRDRIVFTHIGGTMAVAQDGRHFAVGDENGIRIVGVEEVLTWIEET